MLNRLIFLLMLVPFSCSCQTNLNQTEAFKKSSIEKWISATLNIEVEESDGKKINLLDSTFRERLRRKEITPMQYEKLYDSIITISHNRYRGTAILLHFKGNFYLVTARHVLVDTTAMTEDYVYNKIFIIDDFNNIVNHQNDKIMGTNVIKNNLEETTLLGYGIVKKIYILSSVEDDIGIVKLTGTGPSQRGQRLLKTLIKRGYKSVEISDLDTLCNLKVGQKIFIIGYPRESLKYVKNMPEAVYNWESAAVTVPMVIDGQISNISKNKNEFQANIFFYHGNSGGPVIRDGKFIGIVSGFRYYIKTDNSTPPKPYYHFESNFKKSSLVYTLLKKLDSRGNSAE